ncbi:MAG: hypothetical protein ACFFHD_11820 [Promethearchaeota archaeon]
MLSFISIVLNKIVINEYTSMDIVYSLQNRESPAASLSIITISLLIWFGCGFILAYWVKKDMKKKNLEGSKLVIVIFLTSFIGFIIYIMINYGEVEISENGEKLSKFDEFIKDEEKAEFNDEIEELLEEEIEDVIDNILERSK